LAALDGSWFMTKTGNFSFIETARDAKLLSWQQPLRCHFVSFVMHVCGAKIQEHCLNSFRIIVYLVFYHFIVANHMTPLLISETKKDILKRKMPFFCISKGLSNKQKIFFLCHIRFKYPFIALQVEKENVKAFCNHHSLGKNRKGYQFKRKLSIHSTIWPS